MTTFENIVNVLTDSKMPQDFKDALIKEMVIKAYFNNLLEICRTLQQQLNDIKDNILDDLRDIRLADKLGKTSPNVPITPCYAPNGICTNPQMDCINCPKRGAGGTWSTSTNIKTED